MKHVNFKFLLFEHIRQDQGELNGFMPSYTRSKSGPVVDMARECWTNIVLTTYIKQV